MRESCCWVTSIFHQNIDLGHIFPNQVFFLSIFGFICPTHLVDTPRGEFLFFSISLITQKHVIIFFLAMSSRNDGAHKKKKIEKFPPSKISRKLRDMPTFPVGRSSSQTVIHNHPQQKTLPTVNMTLYPPSFSSSATANISTFAPFPSDSRQGTLPAVEGLPNFTWEDSAHTYLNSFNQLWPQYVSSNDVRHIKNCDPTDIMLNNICQVPHTSLLLVFQQGVHRLKFFIYFTVAYLCHPSI